MSQPPFWKLILSIELTGFPEAYFVQSLHFCLVRPLSPLSQWELHSLRLDSVSAWSWRVSLQALGSRFLSLRC